MKTRIYDTELRELLVEAEYPYRFETPDSELKERVFTIDGLLGKGSYTEVFFEGIHIGYGNISLANPTLIRMESDFETVEMHFALTGDQVTQAGDFDSEIIFGDNQHNIFYVDGFAGNSAWSCDHTIRVFEVNLLPSFFQKYLPESKIFDGFKAGIIAKKHRILSPSNYLITPPMMQTIQKIMNCDRKGLFRKMFLEAHVIELLMLQLEQISSFHHPSSHFNLKKRDVEKLHAVRYKIANEIDKPYSLIGLAQAVGTNEFMLKKGFKELFGTTVFGYWNDLKMERAQAMLVEEGMTVAEVSERVGYKNPQHFSTAFKRKYGFSPGQLKGLA